MHGHEPRRPARGHMARVQDALSTRSDGCIDSGAMLPALTLAYYRGRDYQDLRRALERVPQSGWIVEITLADPDTTLGSRNEVDEPLSDCSPKLTHRSGDDYHRTGAAFRTGVWL